METKSVQTVMNEAYARVILPHEPFLAKTGSHIPSLKQWFINSLMEGRAEEELSSEIQEMVERRKRQPEKGLALLWFLCDAIEPYAEEIEKFGMDSMRLARGFYPRAREGQTAEQFVEEVKAKLESEEAGLQTRKMRIEREAKYSLITNNIQVARRRMLRKKMR